MYYVLQRSAFPKPLKIKILVQAKVGTSPQISLEEGNRKSFRNVLFILECTAMDKVHHPSDP